MKDIRHYVAAGFLLLTVAHAAHAQPPIGFERWTAPAESGLVFGAIFADLFKDYSNPASTIHGTLFTPVPPPPPRWKEPRRLIDIEIREVDGLNVVDAVWVNNTGNFKLDSWLINGMTQQQLLEWTRYSGYVMLDIERYRRGSQHVFAGILQRNPNLLEWRILLAEPMDTIELIAGVLGMRVIDIDLIGNDVNGGCQPPPGACFPTLLYDAVLVKNEGSNFIHWHLSEGLNTDQESLVPSGYQLIDREKDGFAKSSYLSVWVGSNTWETYDDLSQFEVVGLHSHSFKRVIDLEIDIAVRQQPTFPIYHTVNIVP